MLKSRVPVVAALLVVAAALLALCPTPPSPAADDKTTADSTTPLAEDIKKLEDVELTFGDQNLTTTLLYSKDGARLFAFPVWVILGDMEVSTRRDQLDWRPCAPGTPFLGDGEPPLLLRLKMDDLLAHEKSRKVVQERLWQEFPGSAGGKGDRLPAERPYLYPDAYSVTLFATSTGRNGLPKEVPVSLPTSPSEVVLKGGDHLYLELLPANLALLAADRGKAVLPRNCFLRVTGSMKARFEDTQCEANFEVLRSTITNLQHRLGSLTPSVREAPEAFVQVPGGGSVESATSFTSVMSQYLVGTISVREGASAPDYAAVLEMAKVFLSQLNTQVNLADLDDGKRIAMLMSNNATLSATVGEIKQLAKQTKEEREKQLALALEESEAHRNNEEREYKGKIGIDVSAGGSALGLGSLNSRVATEVSGEMKKKIEEERANQRKQQMTSLNRDLDELGKRFEGRLPTLTGIRFDQKWADATSRDSAAKFELKRFKKPGPSQVSWPVVYLGGRGPDMLGAKFLADELDRTRLQYKELHEQHEAFKKSVASAERFAQLEKSAQEARELAERLRASLDRIDKLEKQVAALTPKADEIIAKMKKAAGIDLVAIPAQGENEHFLMGSDKEDKDADGDEKPRHKVRITKPFYLGETKVTVGQFKRFVEANPDFKTDAEKAGDKNTWKNPGFEQTDDHPVVYVSWNDAKAYCDWLDGLLGGKGKVRLPREAEWEYSARANSTGKYSFGDDASKLGEYAWFDGNREGKFTRPVRQKKPNDFKLYDVHGLAWEWCWDGKREYPKEPADAPLLDPSGPTSAGASRVIRGGSFNLVSRGCRAASRDDGAPSDRNGNIGFRVLVSR